MRTLRRSCPVRTLGRAHLTPAAACLSSPRLARVGPNCGGARRYKGRPKVDENHTMVKRATQAMLDFIHDCRAVKWTFASAAPSPKVMFSDPKVGLFSQSLLLPDFENGTAIAAALLATQKAEWRKPLGPWNTRTDKEEDEDEETGERQPDAGEDAGARAGEGAGEDAGEDASETVDMEGVVEG